METVRKKPGVKLSTHLREEINQLATKEGVGKNEMLERILRIGLAVYHINPFWNSLKTG